MRAFRDLFKIPASINTQKSINLLIIQMSPNTPGGNNVSRGFGRRINRSKNMTSGLHIQMQIALFAIIGFFITIH